MAFGESTLSKKNVYKWCKLFIESREDVNDDTRLGRPSTSTTDENVEAVKKIVLENHRITIREVVEDVDISVGSCHAIFSDVLGMKRVAPKFVPKLLHFDQKNRRDLLAKTTTIIMPQPPYSPDLTPRDFFLFPKLKIPMKGQRFTTIEEIKTASLRELKAIPKSAYQKCFEDWKERWHECIISEGDYFEGEKIDIDE